MKYNNNNFSTYNPIINFIFFIGAILFGMFFIHPAYLASSLVLSASYLLNIKGRKAFKTIGTFCIVFIVVSVINPLFNTRGETVLFTWILNRPYTLEALFYGMTTAGMLISMLLWFACYNEVMTSDKFLYIFGKTMPSISLVLTMVLRNVANYEKKAVQIAGARKCIGKFPTSNNNQSTNEANNNLPVRKSSVFMEGIKNGLTVLSALTSYALEGAIITADSMKSRGYGTAKRTSFSIYRFDKRDALLSLVMVVFIIVVIFAAANNAVYANYIPVVQIAKIDNTCSLAGIVAYICFLSLPTLLNIVQNAVWTIRLKKI